MCDYNQCVNIIKQICSMQTSKSIWNWNSIFIFEICKPDATTLLWAENTLNSKFWKYLYLNDLFGSWNINKQSWNLGDSDIWQAANAGGHTTELARPIDVGATLSWLANIPTYSELHACAKREINSAWSWILAQIHNNIFTAGPFSLFCDFHRKINTHVCWLFFGTLHVSTSQTVENLCGENCLFGGPIKFLFKLFFLDFLAKKKFDMMTVEQLHVKTATN